VTAATVVIATRDRRERLLATLALLEALPERPPIIVVDNASADGTAPTRRHPGVRVIRCDRDIGAAARTVGAEAASTPLVAFSDDDSWWAPGALARAGDVFAAHPRLGLLAARVLVEPSGRLDPTCERMRTSPLPARPGLPGPAVLGFVACGAVVRREALLESGGFNGRYGFGGEEHLLALDLAAGGWELAYVADVIAHHEPTRRPRPARKVRERRNDLWSAWLRRPLPRAAALTARGDGRALLAALRGLPWVLRERRVVPPELERRLRLLEDTAPSG
jgi:N-acetylglucosaminyl-diphospho-decaprenol L-rhamnosyltransferase